MSRSPLYKAHLLNVDYDYVRGGYVLKRNSEENGSFYTTERQVRSVIASIQRSIKTDYRFKGLRLEISLEVREKLGLDDCVLSEND